MDATKIFRYKEGKYELLSGRDEMMVEALAVGIKGFVGSQYSQLLFRGRIGTCVNSRIVRW